MASKGKGQSDFSDWPLFNAGNYLLSHTRVERALAQSTLLDNDVSCILSSNDLHRFVAQLMKVYALKQSFALA